MALSTDEILAQAKAAGINLSTTPAAAGQEDAGYDINGVRYYTQSGQQQNVGGGGTTGAQQILLANLSNPYLNEANKSQALQQYQSGQYDTYNTTKDPNESFDAYHARMAAGNPTGGSAASSSAATGTTGTSAAQDSSNRNALAFIKGTLAQYDLPDSLADWAWQEIVGGKGTAEVMLDLQQRPEFKQTFPEIEARQKAGLAPLAPSDIINYRQQARQMMQAAGLPQGFYDSPQDFSKFIVNDTSLSELSSRITDAAQAAYNAPPEYKQQWDQLGFGHGDLTAMMLNPDVAEPLLHKQWTAAQLAGTGVRTGYGQLNTDQALGMADLGVTVPQAEQGFGNLAHQQELFNPLNAGETAINQNEQLAAQFGGNAAAQQRIQDRARARVSTFSGGGGFAGTSTGFSGVGNSGQ